MKKLSALLAVLGTAVVYALGVTFFYRSLEDSPYAFNLGKSYPAGIDPDWGNRLSLSWDVIVLASLITLLAGTVGFLSFFISAVRQGGLVAAVFRHVQPFAWLALLAMALILGATFVWGLFARQDAPSLFTQSSLSAGYLTMHSWLVLVVVLALALLSACVVIVWRSKPMRS